MSERDLTPEIQAEIEKPTVSPMLFAEMLFDSGPLRLCNGIGQFILNNEVYTGAGDLVALSEIEENAVDVKASGITMSLSGIPWQSISLCLAEMFQGRQVTIWLVFLDLSSRMVPDPFRIFKGRMDYPILEESGETARIIITAENHLIDLERARVRRYTNADQEALYSDDTGLRYVAGIQNKIVTWSNGVV